MTIKILNLNLWKGKLFSNLKAFLAQNSFDVLHFQEVAGKPLSFSQEDNFQELQATLGMAYTGILAKEYTTIEDNGYHGIATFYHNAFHVLEQKLIQLAPPISPLSLSFIQEKEQQALSGTVSNFFEDVPRIALAVQLEKDGRKFWSINTQLAWNPSEFDTLKKIAAAKPLQEFVALLHQPFVIAGDFNVQSGTQIVQGFEKYAQNLNAKHGITNTLNPRMHKANHLFPPGLAVDFIMPSKQFTVEDFQVLDNLDLSDHFALQATLSFKTK